MRERLLEQIKLTAKLHMNSKAPRTESKEAAQPSKAPKGRFGEGSQVAEAFITQLRPDLKQRKPARAGAVQERTASDVKRKRRNTIQLQGTR